MKILFKTTIVLIIMMCIPITAFAAESEKDLPQEEVQSQLEQIADGVPEETKGYLDELGLEDIDYNDIINISPKQIFSTIGNILTGAYQNPLKGALSIIAIIMLASLLKGFSTSISESSIATVLSSATSVFVAVILVFQLSTCISNSCSVIEISSKFTLAFIPAFTLLVALSGNPVTAAGFSTLIFALAQILSNIASYILMPCANIFLGLGIASGIRPELHLTSITSFIKKNLIMIISFLAMIFMTIVSLKSGMGAGVDALGDKSLRFVLSSFVPVIGSAISDGLGSLKGYLSLMKSAAGIFSIISIALIYLPVIFEIVLWNISLSICSMCSELFEEKSVYSIVKTFQDVLSIILVLLLLCLVVTVVSVGIMISVKSGR